MLFELACLYYEARKNFYTWDLDSYLDACSEVCRLANLAGFTANDMAKMFIEE